MEHIAYSFAGANPAVAPVAEDPLPGVANHLLGNDPAQWRTNVPTSARVRYPGLYPGVDLVVYGTQSGGLEHDVVVAPGADPVACLALSPPWGWSPSPVPA